MFGNKKKIEALRRRVDELEESNSAMVVMFREFQKFNEQTDERIEAIDAVMEDFKKYEENKRIMKDSDEPWADFMTELEPDGRVKVKFDWNKAMIQELRRMGFNSGSEEDIISAYFSRLIGEHGEAMSHEELEEIKNA